jgi:hypothetical protein
MVPATEGCMCTVAMRDGVTPPGSWVASRAKDRHRNLRGPTGSIGMVADGGTTQVDNRASRRAEVGSRIRP